MSRIEENATLLAKLRFSKEQINNLPEASFPVDEHEAYSIQQRLVEKLLAHYGGELVGYKVACTSQHAQQLLNVSGPFSGRMLSATTYQSPATLQSSDFQHRVIEPEFAFVVSQTIPRQEEPYDADSIRPYLGDFRPAIEIVDHRYTDFTVVGEHALKAHNAVHGATVLGEPLSNWKHLDLAKHKLSLTVNGQLYDVGSGAAVLGNPLTVMAWLANDLQRRGETLKKGEVVVTGVATKVYRAEAGDECVADFGSLGSVSVRYV